MGVINTISSAEFAQSGYTVDRVLGVLPFKIGDQIPRVYEIIVNKIEKQHIYAQTTISLGG